MNASDLAAIHAELRHITHILYVVGALTIAAVALTCLHIYWTVKNRVKQRDTFISEAEDLLKQEQFDKLLMFATAKTQEQPNYGHGYWYLAVASYSQRKYAAAIEQFERARKLNPTWSTNYIDPYIREAKRRMEFL